LTVQAYPTFERLPNIAIACGTVGLPALTSRLRDARGSIAEKLGLGLSTHQHHRDVHELQTRRVIFRKNWHAMEFRRGFSRDEDSRRCELLRLNRSALQLYEEGCLRLDRCGQSRRIVLLVHTYSALLGASS